MSKRSRKDKGRVQVQDQLQHNPFADQLAGLGHEVAPEPQGPKTPPPCTPSAKEAGFSSKLVLRREKKGRGGKTVTRIEGIQGDQHTLSDLARQMGKALGVRAFVEEGCLWLSGDQCQSAQRWLEKAGATKIIIGN